MTKQPTSMLHDAEWLRNEYATKSVKQIAKETGTTACTVRFWLMRNRIPQRKSEDAKPRDEYGRYTKAQGSEHAVNGVHEL